MEGAPPVTTRPPLRLAGGAVGRFADAPIEPTIIQPADGLARRAIHGPVHGGRLADGMAATTPAARQEGR